MPCVMGLVDICARTLTFGLTHVVGWKKKAAECLDAPHAFHQMSVYALRNLGQPSAAPLLNLLPTSMPVCAYVCVCSVCAHCIHTAEIPVRHAHCCNLPLRLYVCVCVCMYESMCTFSNVYIYTYMYTCAYMSTCIYIYIHVFILYVCIYIYMYIYMYIYIHIYIDIHRYILCIIHACM